MGRASAAQVSRPRHRDTVSTSCGVKRPERRKRVRGVARKPPRKFDGHRHQRRNGSRLDGTACGPGLAGRRWGLGGPCAYSRCQAKPERVAHDRSGCSRFGIKPFNHGKRGRTRKWKNHSTPRNRMPDAGPFSMFIERWAAGSWSRFIKNVGELRKLPQCRG
jgi:hypothetical protein